MSRAGREPARPSIGSAEERKIHLVQGEFRVTSDPDVMLTTLLGSCVAACLRDPLAGVGGMNHFLLPGRETQERRLEAESYGVHLMELLVNGLLQHGARRERLEAKLFGGGRTMSGLSDIGSLNAEFAERFLANEGIACVGKSLRGEQGRRIQYWPVSGRARQTFITPDKVAVSQPVPRPVPPHAGDCSVEFF
jgi:chemotaxis protein CheD